MVETGFGAEEETVVGGADAGEGAFAFEFVRLEELVFAGGGEDGAGAEFVEDEELAVPEDGGGGAVAEDAFGFPEFFTGFGVAAGDEAAVGDHEEEPLVEDHGWGFGGVFGFDPLDVGVGDIAGA